jgi:hypothetical protein
MTSAQKAPALSYWDRLEIWTRNWNSLPKEGQELVLAVPPSPPPRVWNATTSVERYKYALEKVVESVFFTYPVPVEGEPWRY